MKARINGQEVEGTVVEMQQLLGLIPAPVKISMTEEQLTQLINDKRNQYNKSTINSIPTVQPKKRGRPKLSHREKHWKTWQDNVLMKEYTPADKLKELPYNERCVLRKQNKSIPGKVGKTLPAVQQRFCSLKAKEFLRSY
jgi:hypothetical protein